MNLSFINNLEFVEVEGLFCSVLLVFSFLDQSI